MVAAWLEADIPCVCVCVCVGACVQRTCVRRTCARVDGAVESQGLSLGQTVDMGFCEGVDNVNVDIR